MQKLRSTCDKLGIISKHFVHFGRSVGAVKAELEEMDAALIKNLGNWNPDTQEDRYSAKLPLQVLRIMAGHNRKKGQYHPIKVWCSATGIADQVDFSIRGNANGEMQWPDCNGVSEPADKVTVCYCAGRSSNETAGP